MSETTTDKSHYPTSGALAISPLAPVPVVAVPVQATSDEMLIDLWLHGRPGHTRRAYRADIDRLLRFTGMALGETTLLHLQAFVDTLASTGLAPVSRNRVIAVVKSMFAFAHRLGYLPFDTAKPLRVQSVRDELAQRIVGEPEVLRLIALERHPRNGVLLLVAYASGARVSELSALRWIDCLQHDDGSGQVSLYGKRGRTRVVRLPKSVMTNLTGLRQDAAADDSPVFLSRRGRALSARQVLRVVKRAAKRAGIKRNLVVHSLRHAHASHSLDRGAPISLVQATLGHADISTTGRYLHARPDASSASFLPL